MSLFARRIVKILVHNYGYAFSSPRLAHSFRYVVPRSALKMAYNNSNHKFPNRLSNQFGADNFYGTRFLGFLTWSIARVISGFEGMESLFLHRM